MTASLDVLTPSYNYAEYIADAVNSVRHQIGMLGRHIVVDGDSVDDTVSVLQMYTSESLTWVSSPDEGQSDALNKALDMASSEWIGWLNADEFYLPDALHHVAALAATRTLDADVIYGDCAFVDSCGQLIRLLPAHPFSEEVLRRYGCFIPSCATFVRRGALEGHRWSTGFRRAMDWQLWMTLADSGCRFEYTPKVLSCFRVHDKQVTSTPESHDAAEFSALSDLRGLPNGRVRTAAWRMTGRLGHAHLKAVTGGYARQRRVKRSLGGADLRWWIGDSQMASANALVGEV